MIRFEQKDSRYFLGQYWGKAKLYLLTFLKLYKVQVVLVLLVLLLAVGGALEYLYQRRGIVPSK